MNECNIIRRTTRVKFFSTRVWLSGFLRALPSNSSTGEFGCQKIKNAKRSRQWKIDVQVCRIDKNHAFDLNTPQHTRTKVHSARMN